jgi:hypothetical protein
MSIDIHFFAATLNDSISRYQRILDFLLYMSREMDRGSEVQVQGLAESLSAMQKQATEADSAFLPSLNKEVVLCEALRPLFSQREEVMREVLLKNVEIRRKARVAQSLLAHELGTLRHGQKAMSGYKPQQDRGGKIVNSTS